MGNITRNGFKNQWRDVLAVRQTVADVSGADIHGGQIQHLKGCLRQKLCIKSALSPRKICASSYTYYSELKNRLPPVPALQRPDLVFPDDQKQLNAGLLGCQLGQRIHGVAGATASGFPVIDHDVGKVSKRQVCHGQPMRGRCQHPGFVPRLTGRNDVQCIESELFHGLMCQGLVGSVRRVKRPTKDPHAAQRHDRRTHTQSRLGKKRVYKSSSAEPASGTDW